MKFRKMNPGFTLVEIMIVSAIIALIAAIALPNMFRAKLSANQSAAKATLKSISSAMENYAVINSIYPNTTAALLGASPPYLNTDFFNGTHNGYTFSSTLADYSYTVIAEPVSAQAGTVTYTLTTGGVINPQ